MISNFLVLDSSRLGVEGGSPLGDAGTQHAMQQLGLSRYHDGEVLPSESVAALDHKETIGNRLECSTQNDHTASSACQQCTSLSLLGVRCCQHSMN